MNRLKEKLIQLMAGRYGTDLLNNTIIIFAFALVIISMFIHAPITATIINIIVLGIISFSIFRTYSRNISKRKLENDKFKNITKPLRRKFSIQKMMIRERKTSRFRTCPNCRVVIRTSKERGNRSLTCPRCTAEFETHIYL